MTVRFWFVIINYDIIVYSWAFSALGFGCVCFPVAQLKSLGKQLLYALVEEMSKKNGLKKEVKCKSTKTREAGWIDHVCKSL